MAGRSSWAARPRRAILGGPGQGEGRHGSPSYDLIKPRRVNVHQTSASDRKWTEALMARRQISTSRLDGHPALKVLRSSASSRLARVIMASEMDLRANFAVRPQTDASTCHFSYYLPLLALSRLMQLRPRNFSSPATVPEDALPALGTPVPRLPAPNYKPAFLASPYLT